MSISRPCRPTSAQSYPGFFCSLMFCFVLYLAAISAFLLLFGGIGICGNTAQGPEPGDNGAAKSATAAPRLLLHTYSDDPKGLTIGLATLHARVPDVAANKARIVQSIEVMKEHGVNMAVFPEFALTGYFWKDQEQCRPYMEKAVFDAQADWVAREIRPLLDETLQYVIINAVRRNPAGGEKLLNSTFVVSKQNALFDEAFIYDKTFLPGIENTYSVSGQTDSLVLETPWGRLGFLTCYDLCFSSLAQEYSMYHDTDALLMLASWRGPQVRDYPGVNRGTEWYYGQLLELLGPATAALNQNWLFLANAVGEHAESGAVFAGASAVWAPSGMELARSSSRGESILVLKGVDVQGGRQIELDDFDYRRDFLKIYKELPQEKAFTRF